MAIGTGEWAGIIAAIGGFLTVTGGGIKWWVGRLDKRAIDEIARQDHLREMLRVDLQKQIDGLIRVNRMQGTLINRYAAHVRTLEHIMAKAGMQIPELNLHVYGYEDDAGEHHE